MNDIKKFFLVLCILFTLDFIYLYFNQNWYRKEIIRSQNSPLELKPIGVVARYVSQALGLYLFVLKNNYDLIYSALYGMIVYGNYIGTNYDTIKVLDPKLAITDLIKGSIVMTLTSYIFYQIV